MYQAIIGGLTVAQAIPWINNNIIGGPDFLSEMIDPTISKSVVKDVGDDFGSYMFGDYKIQFKILGPSFTDLQAIDNFFTAYGYRVDRFDNVNLCIKDDFTFIKTKNCNVSSSVLRAAQQMKMMLDAGTTFWKNEIGE